MKNKDIENLIRTFSDFPKKGINFFDISQIVANPKAMKYIAKQFAKFAKANNVDVIVSPDARGFLFGVPTSLKSNIPFIMVRKVNKLPGKTISQKYDLEYGSNELEIQEDAIKPGQNVMIIDDIVAIGGTSKAIQSLIEKAGGNVVAQAYLFNIKELFNLNELKGNVLTLFSK